MKWVSFLSNKKRWGHAPCLKLIKPRERDNVVELKSADSFFHCLKDHHHALKFQGHEQQFKTLLLNLEKAKKIKILRYKKNVNRKNQTQILLHLKMTSEEELRRIITLE